MILAWAQFRPREPAGIPVGEVEANLRRSAFAVSAFEIRTVSEHLREQRRYRCARREPLCYAAQWPARASAPQME
jgi:hypothetical protein